MAANDWTTLTNLKEYLQITDASKDTLLTNLITRCSVALDRYCGREQLKSKQYTEYRDGDGTDTLLMDERPIISVTYLYDDTGRVYASESLIDSDDFIVYGKEGMIKLDGDTINYGAFSVGKQNLKIVYDAGYATIPADAELACLIYCGHIFNKAGTEGHTSLSLGGLSKSFDTRAIPDEVKALVEPFRKRPV